MSDKSECSLFYTDMSLTNCDNANNEYFTKRMFAPSRQNITGQDVDSLVTPLLFLLYRLTAACFGLNVIK